MRKTTQQILEEMERLQNIQKVNPPTSDKWIKASKKLHSLFAIMNGRYPSV